MSKESITQALGIEDEFFEFAKEIIRGRWENADSISDVIEKCAEDIRNESLGNTDSKISNYEKKLVFIGMMIGSRRSAMDLHEVIASGFLDEFFSDDEGECKE